MSSILHEDWQNYKSQLNHFFGLCVTERKKLAIKACLVKIVEKFTYIAGQVWKIY